MTIKLISTQRIPESVLKNLADWKSAFIGCKFLEQVLEKEPLYTIAAQLNELCLEDGLIGYHFTRATREEIENRGLIAGTGHERRRQFLAQHGHRFSEAQRERICQKWESYFAPSQTLTRDNRIWFNFTLTALDNGGAEDLLTYYGGEVINMPLTEDEEIATILRTIGQPLIVECSLETQRLHTFSKIPWGKIWLSSYHVGINPHALQFDVDAYQEQCVPPNQIVSISIAS